MSSIIPLLTEYEKQHISERQALPEKYLGLSDTEMATRIAAARATLGDRLVILGHHYQRDEVIRFADYVGDSFRLARQIAQRPEREKQHRQREGVSGKHTDARERDVEAPLRDAQAARADRQQHQQQDHRDESDVGDDVDVEPQTAPKHPRLRDAKRLHAN
jgi:hypothetical protein